jgi:DNA-binding LacI/PurR family transcriptional regulator
MGRALTGGETVVSSTLRGIAELVGVSIATVSRVVNGAENVSSETRTKVLSAISTSQYSPNTHAAQLARGNGGRSKKRGASTSASADAGRRKLAEAGACAKKKSGETEKLRLLEEENTRLKRLITNLSMDLEMWRRISESP